MAISGLDVEQVKHLGTQLEGGANEIDQILSTLTNLLANTTWEGPDAVQFRGEWSGSHSSTLRNASNALRSASQQAHHNATAQEDTARR